MRASRGRPVHTAADTREQALRDLFLADALAAAGTADGEPEPAARCSACDDYERFARREIEHQTDRAEKAEATLGLILNVGFHRYVPGWIEPLERARGEHCVRRRGERSLPCGAPKEHPVHRSPGGARTTEPVPAAGGPASDLAAVGVAYLPRSRYVVTETADGWDVRSLDVEAGGWGAPVNEAAGLTPGQHPFKPDRCKRHCVARIPRAAGLTPGHCWRDADDPIHVPADHQN